jgi:hypothetical protein
MIIIEVPWDFHSVIVRLRLFRSTAFYGSEIFAIFNTTLGGVWFLGTNF